jgi:hypothetical protein
LRVPCCRMATSAMLRRAGHHAGRDTMMSGVPCHERHHAARDTIPGMSLAGAVQAPSRSRAASCSSSFRTGTRPLPLRRTPWAAAAAAKCR